METVTNIQSHKRGTQKEKTAQSGAVRYASCFTIRNTLEMVDFFKRPLPVFNIRGRDLVPSYCGAFTSLLILLVVTIYGLSKFV